MSPAAAPAALARPAGQQRSTQCPAGWRTTQHQRPFCPIPPTHPLLRHGTHPRCSYDPGDKRTQLEGLLYSLDIAHLLGDKLPPCKPSDYETWTVPDEAFAPRCLLGAWRGRARGFGGGVRDSGACF